MQRDLSAFSLRRQRFFGLFAIGDIDPYGLKIHYPALFIEERKIVPEMPAEHAVGSHGPCSYCLAGSVGVKAARYA